MNKNKNFYFNTGNMKICREKPLIIAELGTSHNGDIAKARQMISAAAEAGSDCVKFQIVYADEILHPNTGLVDLPGGKIRLYDTFKSLEKPPEFYQEIKEYAEALGLLFLCTPFGLKSASILHELKPKMVKIASPELNYTGLLTEIAKWNIPVLLSSGVSRLSDIEEALDILKKTQNKNNICLLHCVTSYPAPETEYNLNILSNLALIFGVSTGVSDHSLDPELVPALSLCMGACVIEKHFCLSRDDPGLDDPIALPPKQFSQMVKSIRSFAGTDPEDIIKHYKKKNGDELIKKILGSGVKELAQSEKENYRRTNRSVHALRDIQKGEIISKNDYAVLRTEKILRPGLEPKWEKMIEGRTAGNFIPSGEGIRFEDV
jgi:sialic acid synthase SpsE